VASLVCLPSEPGVNTLKHTTTTATATNRQQGQGLLPPGTAFDLFRGTAHSARDEVETYPSQVGVAVLCRAVLCCAAPGVAGCYHVCCTGAYPCLMTNHTHSQPTPSQHPFTAALSARHVWLQVPPRVRRLLPRRLHAGHRQRGRVH